MVWLLGRYLWWRREALEARADGAMAFWLFLTMAWLFIGSSMAFMVALFFVATWPWGALVVLAACALAWVLWRACTVESPELDELERQYLRTGDPQGGASA